MQPHALLLSLLTLLLLGVVAHGNPPPADTIEFARDIQPLFAQRCLLCHGPDDAEGGLQLHLRELALRQLDSGEHAIVPGQPEESELLRRVTSDDPGLRMPPEGDTLSPAEVNLLRAWIAEGATWQVHWAYRPLEPGTPPEVQDPEFIRNDLDRYVVATLQEKQLPPSPAADRPTLIKRLYYDLVGLTPTPEEVDAFVEDSSPRAYEVLVDHLLASPHFGERWGRHWLDKARYADSDGYEKDNHRPDAWRYRDWVIAAINDDLPFDQFTIEQLAGDLLPSPTPLQRLATAFNRQTLTNTEGGTDQEQWRVAAVMDRTETLGTVWLGLSVGCARCHSHKYDQITHHEYYQLYAYFNNGDEITTEVPKSAADIQAARLDRIEESSHGRNHSPDQPNDQPAPDVADETISVRVIGERTNRPRTTHVLRRGEFKEPLEEVATGTLTMLPPIKSRHNRSTTDRLDLARWLVDGDNPLVPRVAVNHIWKHLFGQGIVATMDDFGVRGDPPTHPQLLDHLATRFVADGWSRKRLIKYIVSSATYRQSSWHRPELEEIDPRNQLLHRQNRFRVEAEIIRDASLAASGLLSRKIGGPSVFPPIPPSITDLTYNSSFQWKTSEGDDRYRRGMYTYFKRTAPHPNLITFDCPDSNVTSVQRERSNTPIGALVTLNNETFVEAAQAMAQHVLSREDLHDDRAKLRYALRRCIARVPSAEEVDDFANLLETSRRWYAEHLEAAQDLLGSHPATGVPHEENAAWIATLRMMLNLDEFMTRE